MAGPSLSITQGVLKIDDRAANFHPQVWSPDVYRIRPLGQDTPLTTLMDEAFGSTPVESRTWNYAIQPYNNDTGTVTDVYTDSALSSAYASGGVSGSVLYIKMAEVDAKKFRVFDLVTINDTTNHVKVTADVVAAPTLNGTSSYLQVSLREADTGNRLASSTLTYTNSSRAEREVAELPDGMYEEPTWYSASSQIIMEAYELSDREIIELERIEPNVRSRMKKQAWERWMRKRERMRLLAPGGTAASGGRTFARGLYYYLKDSGFGNGSNIINWKTDTTYSSAGQTWLQGAWDFLNNVAEYRGQYSGKTVLEAYTSGKVLTAIDRLVRDMGTVNLSPTQVDEFGFRVRRLDLGREQWKLHEVPLWSIDTALQKSMLVLDPDLVKTRTLQGKRFIQSRPKSQETGEDFITAEKAGWIVDEGIECRNWDAILWLDALGDDK